MAIEKFKDVTINGVDYRVGLVTALVGDWIARQLPLGMKNLTPETWTKIQYHLLETCSWYKVAPDGTRGPMKIFSNGKWLVPSLDLEYDKATVNALCERALEFNFDDFFKAKFAEVEAAAKAEAQTSGTTQ